MPENHTPRPRRTHAQARAEMRAAIIEHGNDQLARVGAAALSVREIARAIGVASSAIYRHVANRDALLTLLLTDAFEDLAEAVDASQVEANRVDGGSPHENLRGLVTAMRAWALAQPARWGLLYGTPVPGYQAPAEVTTDPGVRVMGRFLGLVAAGASAAGAPTTRAPELSDPLAGLLVAGAEELGLAAPPDRAADALLAWSGLVGVISAEVFGHWGPDLTGHGAELLDRWVVDVADRFGLG